MTDAGDRRAAQEAERLRRGAHDLYRECEGFAALAVRRTKAPFRSSTSRCPLRHLLLRVQARSSSRVVPVAPSPVCLLAMAFYGINSIGEVIERPSTGRRTRPHRLARAGASARKYTPVRGETPPTPRGRRDEGPAGLGRFVARARIAEDSRASGRREPARRARRGGPDSGPTAHAARSKEPRFSQVRAPRARVARPRLRRAPAAARECGPGQLLVRHRFAAGLNARGTAPQVRRRRRGLAPNAASRPGADVERSSRAPDFHSEAHAVGRHHRVRARVLREHRHEVLRGQVRGGDIYHGSGTCLRRVAERAEAASRGRRGERDRRSMARGDAASSGGSWTSVRVQESLRERGTGTAARGTPLGVLEENGGGAFLRGRHRVRPEELLGTEDLPGTVRALASGTDAERARYLRGPANRSTSSSPRCTSS